MFKLFLFLGACFAASAANADVLQKESVAETPSGHVGTCSCADGATGMLGEKDECICKSHAAEVKPHLRHAEKKAVAPGHYEVSLGDTVTTPTTPNPNVHQTTMGSQIAIIITGALLSIGLLSLIVYGFITLTQFAASDTVAI